MKTEKEIVEEFWKSWESEESNRYDVRNKTFVEDAVIFGIKQGRKQLAEEFFNDKFIEARLCFCNAIQNLKLKDANKISYNHKNICYFLQIKEIYKEKLQKDVE